MRSWTIGLGLLAVGGLAVLGCSSPQPVTTGTLLDDLTNLARLAEFPDPAYTCRQFSSYDRESTSPDDREKWFANRDFSQFLRQEQHGGRTEWVLMDADGPGAIVRIWSANPKGTLRIYLDHDEAPALEAPLPALLAGEVPGLPSPLACVSSRGWNLYFPIPYAEHCKVTSDQDGFYYHVNYRTYPPKTPVVTFKRADVDELVTEIARAAEELARVHTCPLVELGKEIASKEGREAGQELRPGDKTELGIPQALTRAAGRSQGEAIDEFCVLVSAADRLRALRQLVLTMEFDGEQTVACPLSDFFGAGPGVQPYHTLPMGIDAQGLLWSRWVMPYRKAARLVLHNQGDQVVRVRWALSTRDYDWTSRSLHFHADWRVGRDVPTRPFQDWNYLTARGRGVFVGAAFTLVNPSKIWWGEGDEKIYVDGEAFPSHFGTGTEDYFGYAWGSPERFNHAYHSQPQCDGPANYGRTAVNRWHILDRIPFRKDFRFDMELWHWWEGVLPEMSVVAYWYARPAAAGGGEPALTPADLKLATIPPYVAARVAGALEGEELRIAERTATVEPQAIDGCSNDTQLWWRDGQPGDKLTLVFGVAEAGRYQLRGRFLKARDYGIVQLAVDGTALGGPLDFYSDRLLVTDELPLGTLELSAGEHRLTVEIVGAHAEAEKRHMFGLDYVRLQRAE